MTDALIRVAAFIGPLAWPSISCGVFAVIAGSVAPALYVRNLSAFAVQFVPAALALCTLSLAGAAIVRRPAAPLSELARTIRRLGAGVLGIAAGMCFGMAAFWTMKFQIPRFVPFYADRALAEMDRMLQFGDPWRWAHFLVPWPAAMPVMLAVYFPGWLISLFGCIALAALHPSDALRSRYLLSLAAIYLGLGIVFAAVGSSVGPLSYDRFLGGDRFTDLILVLKQGDGADYHFFIADRLDAAYTSGAKDILAGISAMPSIHVAVATLNALFLTQIHRWLAIAGWVFVALTMFGSVYFGWQYAVDGYVSVAAVLLFWRLFGVPRHDEQSTDVEW
ncbi:phosphatase PAP2 family protein [Ensifer sp. B1-9]|uniref:phosphatase PAP2 family protein n=1 Tax=Ensifer sp. B1-9 TaxID=3141455 RepID=UPI003D242516